MAIAIFAQRIDPRSRIYLVIKQAYSSNSPERWILLACKIGVHAL